MKRKSNRAISCPNEQCNDGNITLHGYSRVNWRMRRRYLWALVQNCQFSRPRQATLLMPSTSHSRSHRHQFKSPPKVQGQVQRGVGA